MTDARPPLDLRQLLVQALSLHQRGQFEQAAQTYIQVLQREPANFAALQLLGALRGQQGQTGEAIKHLEAALALQPRDFGTLNNYGQVLMSAGQFTEALAAFDKALTAKPGFFEALYNKAVALAHLQRYADALGNYDLALASNPTSVACLYNRGISQGALGRHRDALESYERALVVSPQFAPAWDNRGNTLRELGQVPQALESYDKAIALGPKDFRAHYNRGNALSDLHRVAEAIESFDRALALAPHFVEAHNNRGLALLTLERYGDALQNFDASLALRPQDPEILTSRGTALWHQGRFAEARISYDKALAIDPAHVPALLNRAFLFQQESQFQNALADYDRLLAAEPANARALNGRGSVLHALKRPREAFACFDKAVGLDPTLSDGLVNRAHLRWSEHGDYDGAISDLRAALAINADLPFVRGELLHLKMYAAVWADFDSESAAIEAEVRAGREVVRPFVYQALSHSPADLQACSRIFTESFFPAPSRAKVGFPSREGRIRVGYLSGEFRDQATAHLMAGLYELHDREQFEIIAIDSGGGDGSAMRQRLEAAFDRIIYISHMSDDQAADRIRSERIDILVNLNGYFGTPRMGIFARRAAPIQVNYLGFPATLGAPYMDYILADEVVIPRHERRHYDEQVAYLPHCYQVNDRKRPIAEYIPSRAELGLPEQGFVFCNFNQSYKITPSVFASWMRILQRVPDSILWLLASKPPFGVNLSKTAARSGLAPGRLVFGPSLAPDKHLARLKRADLFLDTLPYNAHTTASDALWAGVPLLTCRGTTFPGRVAASLLGAIGMPDLVTESAEEYEAAAVALARDPVALAEARNRLGRNRLIFPLFDTNLFRKNIEAAYSAMWRGWKEGNPPASFSIEPEHRG